MFPKGETRLNFHVKNHASHSSGRYMVILFGCRCLSGQQRFDVGIDILHLRVALHERIVAVY